jgi:cell division septum initiation protein DivIVA
MSISNNIDGSSSGGANQLLDLVSNPAVYEAKVKSLQNAIDLNQKYVEAVAPVSEILDLREKIKADKANSANALTEAKQQANTIVEDAKAKANAIIADANDKATQITSEANEASKQIKASLSEAKAAKADAKSAKDASDALTVSLQQQLAIADKTTKDAEKARQAAEALKADILEKHTAFIKGL